MMYEGALSVWMRCIRRQSLYVIRYTTAASRVDEVSRTHDLADSCAISLAAALQRCDGRFGQTRKDGVAIVESTERKCRDEGGSHLWSVVTVIDKLGSGVYRSRDTATQDNAQICTIAGLNHHRSPIQIA